MNAFRTTRMFALVACTTVVALSFSAAAHAKNWRQLPQRLVLAVAIAALTAAIAPAIRATAQAIARIAPAIAATRSATASRPTVHRRPAMPRLPRAATRQ